MRVPKDTTSKTELSKWDFKTPHGESEISLFRHGNGWLSIVVKGFTCLAAPQERIQAFCFGKDAFQTAFEFGAMLARPFEVKPSQWPGPRSLDADLMYGMVAGAYLLHIPEEIKNDILVKLQNSLTSAGGK